MPYADSQGISIYYEVEGEGPPPPLNHRFGNAQGVRIYRYVEPLSTA
jgi:hypothetical protein